MPGRVWVAQAKQNKKVDLSTWDSRAAFPAVHGAGFAAKLSGPGLTADAITILGPGGAEIPFTAKGKPGKVSVTAVLDDGTGEYRMEFDRSGLTDPAALIDGSASIKLPK
ncbi:MAG: hypothetical protein MUE73_21290 [Planctomycetes bacterium]|nr:hypothetical protein [Planctomycetota bacterium]